MSLQTSSANLIQVDTLIFGGGAAGLWLLDELARHGHRCILLEAHALGSGQTIGSQGIIHGGLKYTLKGVLSGSADAIKEMPAIWRRCLAGEGQPDLSGTRLRASFCYLWRSASLSSRVGMIGAKAALRVKPVSLASQDKPAVLAQCPGAVDRIDEQVLSPASLIKQLAEPHRAQLLKIDTDHGLHMQCQAAGQVEWVELENDADPKADRLKIRPRYVVLCAGGGNAPLRRLAGLDDTSMQRRPLHMVMLKGPLPTLNGHCVDGRRTRVTITTDQDASGRNVWQVGGQVAEDGVSMTTEQLIGHTRDELRTVLPGLDLDGAQWATYRVDRAENKTRGGRRPENAYVELAGNVITAWPTKLALVPAMVKQVVTRVGPPADKLDFHPEALDNWPRPQVASPPWEIQSKWYPEP